MHLADDRGDVAKCGRRQQYFACRCRHCASTWPASASSAARGSGRAESPAICAAAMCVCSTCRSCSLPSTSWTRFIVRTCGVATLTPLSAASSSAVAKLLDRNSHRVESFGRIHLPGLVHRRNQAVSSAAAAWRRAPSATARRSRCIERGRRPNRACGQSCRRRPCSSRLSITARRRRARARRRRGHLRRRYGGRRRDGELIEEQQRDVELTHGAERPGQAPDLARAPCLPCCPSGQSTAPAPPRAAAATPPAPGARLYCRPRWRPADGVGVRRRAAAADRVVGRGARVVMVGSRPF